MMHSIYRAKYQPFGFIGNIYEVRAARLYNPPALRFGVRVVRRTSWQVKVSKQHLCVERMRAIFICKGSPPRTHWCSATISRVCMCEQHTIAHKWLYGTRSQHRKCRRLYYDDARPLGPFKFISSCSTGRILVATYLAACNVEAVVEAD